MITIISSYSYPANNATANRVRFMQKSILKYYAATKIQIVSNQPDRTASKELLNSIQLSPLNLKKSKNLILRALKELFISIKIAFLINKESKLQIYTVPSPLILLSVHFRRKNRFAIDVRDCSWDYIEEKSKFGKISSRILKLLLKPIFNKAIFITCTNEYEFKSIYKNFNKKSVIIPNGIETEKYKILSDIPAIQNGTNNSVKLTYAGNIGYAQSLITLINSATKLKDINFELIGDGVHKKMLINEINIKKIQNVKISSPMGWNRLLKKYNDSDILYAQITNDFYSAIPSKIYEYIATGRKVVLGLPSGPARDIFCQFSGVYIHEPKSVSGCIKAIKNAKDSPSPDCEGNRLLLKNYLRENFEKTFYNLVAGI